MKKSAGIFVRSEHSPITVEASWQPLHDVEMNSSEPPSLQVMIQA
jgi:hypothetical protein